jgi:hypothetical protein
VISARMKKATKPLGMKSANTLYGQSICPDEINNEKGTLADLLEVFPLGGIGGPPFVGQTGFKAFSHHVPDGGNIFMLFGPHIGISDAGEVGKYLRRGQKHHSTACGALCAAYNSCCDGKFGPEYHDPVDLQQNWLRDSLAPACPQIQKASNPMAALAVHSYEMVEKKIMAIVDNEFGPGYLVLLGGVQINMPMPYEDHFMPLYFKAHKAGAEPIDLISFFDIDIHAQEMVGQQD